MNPYGLVGVRVCVYVRVRTCVCVCVYVRVRVHRLKCGHMTDMENAETLNCCGEFVAAIQESLDTLDV